MPERFRFLVDETALREAASGGVGDACRAFEHLVAIVDGVRSHSVGKLSQIWEEQIGPYPLYEWLFNQELGMDRDTARACQVVLDRTPDWDAAWESCGLPVTVSLPNGALGGISVAAAARATQAGHATGCLSPLEPRSGGLPVAYEEGVVVTIHFIAALPSDALRFFRSIPATESMDERAYFENARFAFPDLVFVRARTIFSNFDEAYDTIRDKVTEHLGVLNDHARRILGAAVTAQVKQAQFGALGIEASGENGNTRRHTSAMRQREVTVGDRTVACDWHTKLRRHVDRIYFNATSLDGVVVGVFHRHLD